MTAENKPAPERLGNEGGRATRSASALIDDFTPRVVECASTSLDREIIFTPDLKKNRLNADGRYWNEKPTASDAMGITRRLQQQEPMVVTCSRFCRFVEMGGTFTGAVYNPGSGSGWGEFVGMQLFSLDFDNAAPDKRPLRPGEAGYLDPLDALERAYGEGLPPVCLYFTFHAKALDAPRYRVVFANPEPVRSEADAKAVIRMLMGVFPECDRSCKNPNRLFYGSSGEVWQCWAARDPFGLISEEGA